MAVSIFVLQQPARYVNTHDTGNHGTLGAAFNMKTNYDTVVIGGGPAGSQCVLWLTKLGLDACMVEPSEIGGLQARSPYTNSWLSVVQATTSAKQVAQNIAANVSSQGCIVHRINCDKINYSDQFGVFTVHSGDQRIEAKNVVIATGTKERTGGLKLTNQVLGLVGAFSMECLGLRVAIIGGGDASCEAYQLAKEKAAKDVKIFARNVRARSSLWDAIPVADKYVGVYAASDSKIDHRGGSYDFDIICICYGWEAVVPELGFNIDTNDIGRIVVDKSMQTSLPGLYAIGDNNDASYPCVATAISDGVCAAKSIERFMNEYF
ncbi:NAD(P)/FAD-dependent oxidoreductase [Hoeflea sp. G2-23]|uniref:Thioredoxin reductase n=1 Tax=Hoeflea algicola TaxID=2983763 RepID=A0ABT3Z4A4_9HYPH|nr:NAD(P)/FAD-dependent oxidoreductase [Hoeflea algicola]MCY0146567.1 NAD(P)/FAD-dependent oxidoreductase [Hoeflea algicola]